MMEIGQIVYQAYGDALGWHDSDSGIRLLPRWYSLLEKEREAWRAAARTAIQKGWKDGQRGMSTS